MTVSPPSSPSAAPPAPPEREPHLGAAVIDRSCRGPVLTLFGAAVVWLMVGAVLGLISAIKAHAPDFIAGVPFLTYGRVRPASLNAFAYGFILQAGLGTGLWLTCRLGRNRLQGAWGILAGTVIWNIGLVMGIGLLLAGGNTGHPWLEIPPVATPVLFWGYLLVAGWGLVTLHVRQERRMYVSQWFVLAALVWIPWVYSTAQALVIFFPVRGVMQAVVDGWFWRNFYELGLAPMGLAALFYFLPKLLRRPLYSYYVALFGFWLLVLFGGWGGLRPGEPVPNWLSSVSVVSRVLLTVPVLAFGLSWWVTARSPGPPIPADPLLRFMFVAAGSYFLAAVLKTVSVLPHVISVTLFTLFGDGLDQLRIHGFLNMALAGAIYYIAPRLAGTVWPSPRLIRAHFLCALVGVVASALPLLIGGVLQGSELQQPQTAFLTVMRHTVPFLGTNSLGMVFLLVAYGIFAVHLGQLLAANCPWAGLVRSGRQWLASSTGERRGA